MGEHWFSANLTEYAPGCEGRPTDQRWLRRYGPEASATGLAALLERLGRRQGEVDVRLTAMGDVVVLSARQGEPRVPLAFIVDGHPLIDGAQGDPSSAHPRAGGDPGFLEAHA
jgi:hypothetical protein